MATKVDIKRRFDDADINIWRSISFLLRNAFVQAIRPLIDHTISINQLDEEKMQKKTALEKLFGGTKKKEGKTKSSEKAESPFSELYSTGFCATGIKSFLNDWSAMDFQIRHNI